MVSRISEYWHPVAESADIGNAPVAVELLGMPVVLFRSGDCGGCGARSLRSQGSPSLDGICRRRLHRLPIPRLAIRR